MEGETIIRLAASADVAGIENVARRTWGETYAEIVLPANQERLLGRHYSPVALEEVIAQEHSWLFVAAAGETIVGFAQFIVREDRNGQLTRIYVLPEWQRQGIGRRLLSAGLDVLASQGVQQLLVHVEKNNPIGVQFYKDSRFCPVREFSVDLPDQALVLLEYALALPPEECAV